MARLDVLVTGVGGVYGDATVQSLRRSTLDVRVVGADLHWHAPGALTADVPAVLPPVAAENYADELVALVKRHRAKAVFVCSGTEIRALARRRDELERASGALFVLPSAESYELASDKLETARWLEKMGFAFPATCSSADELPPPLPLMAKPRFGQGSRGLAICRTAEDVARIRAIGEDYVLQELLGDDEHEYTVGVIATEEGLCLGSIVLRRWLAAGQTGACEVVASAAIASYAEDIAKALRPRGYVNVQIRLRGDAPVAFEINARVSSSTGFRTLAGFNEAELVLRHYLLGETPPRPTVREIAMVRGYSERVVDAALWKATAPK